MYCVPGWSPKRLIVRFYIVMSTISEIVGYHAEIVLEILIVDRLSASPGAGRKRRRRRRSVAHSCHDIKTQQVISTK